MPQPCRPRHGRPHRCTPRLPPRHSPVVAAVLLAAAVLIAVASRVFLALVSRRGYLPNNNNQQITGGYAHFSNVAQDLAALSPSETLEKLELDPFGIRAFTSKIVEDERKLGRVLTIDEIQQIFPCPRNEERITLPDVRVEQKARDFRDGKNGTFLFSNI